MTSAINRVPSFHAAEEQGEKYHRDKQKLCPYPLKTVVEKPISMKASKNIKYMSE